MVSGTLIGMDWTICRGKPTQHATATIKAMNEAVDLERRKTTRFRCTPRAEYR